MSPKLSKKKATVFDFAAMFALSLGITDIAREDLQIFDDDKWNYLLDWYVRHPQLEPGPDTRYGI